MVENLGGHRVILLNYSHSNCREITDSSIVAALTLFHLQNFGNQEFNRVLPGPLEWKL